METINLGDLARDTITRFTGVVVAESKWLHGCRRLTLQPRELHEGQPLEPQTFDAPQLELVEPEQVRTTGDTGGPAPTPTRAAVPPRR